MDASQELALAFGGCGVHQVRDSLLWQDFRLSKFDRDIFAELQPGDLGGEADDGLLQNIIQVRGNQPATRQGVAHFSEVFTVWIKFFRCPSDVAALAALSVGMLRAAFEERGVRLREFS
jgi:hypothetical protein